MTCPFRLVEDDYLQSKLFDDRRDLQAMYNRLRHLLESEFIRRFDEKDLDTGEYIRDINDVDKLFYGE